MIANGMTSETSEVHWFIPLKPRIEVSGLSGLICRCPSCPTAGRPGLGQRPDWPGLGRPTGRLRKLWFMKFEVNCLENLKNQMVVNRNSESKKSPWFPFKTVFNANSTFPAGMQSATPKKHVPNRFWKSIWLWVKSAENEGSSTNFYFLGFKP